MQHSEFLYRNALYQNQGNKCPVIALVFVPCFYHVIFCKHQQLAKFVAHKESCDATCVYDKHFIALM